MMKNTREMSKAIQAKAKELIPNYPDCTKEEIFECMPDFYRLVRDEMKLLPENITFQQFWEAAVTRYQIISAFGDFGFFR